MRKIKRIVIVIATFLLIIAGTSCENSCMGELDPSTFDDFSASIFKLVIGNDELTMNYLFKNPEDFGLEHGEATLPTPSLTTATSKALISFIFGNVKRYDYEKLNEDQQITYNILVDLGNKINSKTTEMGYLSNNYLGSYLGYQAQLPLLLVQYNFRNKNDVENYFKYLDLVPETFEKYVAFEIEKAEKGYGMSDFIIDKVVKQCENFVTSIEESDHFMITEIEKKIDGCEFLTEEEKSNYKILNIEKVNGPLFKGYEYVKNELPKLKGKSKNDQGLAHYVNDNGEEIGKQYYELDFMDTVGYDIKLVDAIKYIDDKIEILSKKVNEYRELYKNDEDFRKEVSEYKLMNVTPEEQLAYYQNAFNDYFPELLVKPSIEVKYIAKAMEKNFSPAAYMTSAIDELDTEYIYLNNASIRLENGELDYNYLYTTLAHEGYPGHLYQNVYFKNKDVNVLRKVIKSSGYVEGWATYTENFSFELLRGKFSDRLIDYLITIEDYNAAINSRLDMGIHYDGWSREEFNNFVLNFNPNANIDNLSKAYEQLIEIPNNYQQYFFTYLKIKDLVNEIKLKEKENFDYKTVHKYILDCGPMPLKFVEEYVKSKYN